MGLGRGETQLHAVCRTKKAEELRRLLLTGEVDINVADAMDRTPLYSAVGSDAVEIVHVSLMHVVNFLRQFYKLLEFCHYF